MSASRRTSVILSNYNGADYIGETIDSVFSQTVEPGEFVIVDDASTDGSVEVIEKRFADAPFPSRLVRHEANQGQAGGFNTGLEETDGGLVCFLDADDLWKPNKIERMLGAVMRHPEAALYQHQLAIVRDGVWTDEPALPALTTGDVWTMWQEHDIFPLFVPTTGIAIRREILDKIAPIPATLRISADSYLTRASICHGPVVSINEVLGGYRRHANNNVGGNRGHDSVDFLRKRVAPLLIEHYAANGLRPPATLIRMMEWAPPHKLLDLSMRKILRQIGIA